MQTLAAELATTFADDALALIRGFGRAVIYPVTAPINRIARACDVAGLLTERRAALRRWRTSRDHSEGSTTSRRRPTLLARLSPFRRLSHLT